jgi:hypothetical protein
MEAAPPTGKGSKSRCVVAFGERSDEVASGARIGRHDDAMHLQSRPPTIHASLKLENSTKIRDNHVRDILRPFDKWWRVA